MPAAVGRLWRIELADQARTIEPGALFDTVRFNPF
jgi:hypothetical protein